MKIISFVKSLMLIWKRRKALLESSKLPLIRNIAESMILAICASVLFAIAFPPSEMRWLWTNPRTLHYCWYLPTGVLDLTIDSGLVRLLAGLAVILWALLIIIAVLSCLVLYWTCAEEIVTKKAVPANHGNTIAEVLRRLRHEPVEYLAVFTAEGEKIGESTNYNSGEVWSHDKMWKSICTQKGCINIHNHPCSRNGFSANDFASAITYRASKTIVVAQGFVYTLELTPECWLLNGDDVKKQFEQAYKYCRALCKEPTCNNHAHFILAINVMLAQQLGMKLTVEHFRDCQYLRAKATTSVDEAVAATVACNDIAVRSGRVWHTSVLKWLKKLIDA